VAFTLLVLWPKIGWRPLLMPSSALVFIVNRRSLDLVPADLPVWVNPVALVGSIGLAVTLGAGHGLAKVQALRLASLGTRLGFLFKWGLDVLPGRIAIVGPRGLDFLLGFWARQGPVAWFIFKHKRRSAQA
jgi:hypothetical protein